MIGSFLRGKLKQIFNEFDLIFNISFFNLFTLSLLNHVHGLIPPERPPSRVKGLKAKAGFNPPLDKPMILFNNIVQVLDLSDFTSFRKESFLFEFLDRYRISGFLSTVITRGVDVCEDFKDFLKNSLAALVSLFARSMKSIVFI